jgi:probable rRNA maturation factor
MRRKSNVFSLLIDTVVSSPAWSEQSFDIETAIKKALAMADVPIHMQGRDLELSVVLTDDAHIQTLNRDYRKKDKPTNVLSFTILDEDSFLPEGEAYPLGDIILAYETIEREAAEQGKSFHDHVLHLLVHGTLHLLGYDHENDTDANAMESLEISALAQLGIANPYTS